MPIINAQHPRNLAWTSVSFPMSLDLIPETNQVMIGYGSGDKASRVKMMPWQDVAALFPPAQHEPRGAWRYRDLMGRMRRALRAVAVPHSGGGSGEFEGYSEADE